MTSATTQHTFTYEPHHYTAEMLTDRLEEIRAILRDPKCKVGALLADEQIKIAEMLLQTIEAIKTCGTDV